MLAGGLLAAACSVGPDYERPPMVTPATYRGQAKPEAQTFGDLPWWQVFKDPTLQGLLVEAQKNNYDLRIAVTRVEQARALAVQARSAFYPTLDYSGGVSRGRNSFLGSVSPNGGDTTSNALATLNVAWEIDLWGKIRRSNEAATARLLSTVEARNGVMVSLIADVAQAYYELLELDLEKQIAIATTESFARSLKLFQDRLNAGAASKLDTSRAEASLASTAANIPELERQIAIKENQICVLLGRSPGPIKRDTTLLAHAVPPEIPAGIPATLLRRRPDVREAEANLIAANADIGVAVGQFFPQIGLTSLLGKVSPELSAFSAGSSNAWSVAATVAGPIFNGGLLLGQYKQAKGAYKEAELSYERTVLVSLQEVSNALVTREKLELIRSQQARAVQAYQESVRLSILRYMAGKADYFEVIDAQQQLFPTENALAQTQLDRLTVVVQLYKALGGGWTEETPAQELKPEKKKPAASKVSKSSKTATKS